MTPAVGGTVSLAWSAVTAPDSGTVKYFVTRDGGDPAGTCAVPAVPVAATSCKDSEVSVGNHTYTVTAVWRSWSATSVDLVGENHDRRRNPLHDRGGDRDAGGRRFHQPDDRRQGRKRGHRHHLHRLALAGLLRRLLQPRRHRPDGRQQLRHRHRLRQSDRAQFHPRRRQRQLLEKRPDENLPLRARRRSSPPRARSPPPRRCELDGGLGRGDEIYAHGGERRRRRRRPSTISRSLPSTPTATPPPLTPAPASLVFSGTSGRPRPGATSPPSPTPAGPTSPSEPRPRSTSRPGSRPPPPVTNGEMIALQKRRDQRQSHRGHR